MADWARLHREVPPPALPGDLPADLAGFVQAALLKKPGERLAAIQPFLRAWSSHTESLLVSKPPVPRDSAAAYRVIPAEISDAMTVADKPC